MEIAAAPFHLILILFALGYAAIISEVYTKVHKSAVALLIAGLVWIVYFVASPQSPKENLQVLGNHVFEISEILFFLMGAMALVELIDSHNGFKAITDRIHTTSKRKMLLIIAVLTFFLSSIFDNLTTTILMVSLLRRLVKDANERFTLSCIVVVAANAGGAWTPIGDVTTTMLWIGGQVSTLSTMKTLFLPSLVSLLFPLFFFYWKTKKTRLPKIDVKEEKVPGSTLIFILGALVLISVPVLHTFAHVPPFMGVLLGLAILWIVTDLLHYPFAEREHLRVPHILTRIDTSGILFFLGILLSVKALESIGFLHDVAIWLSDKVPNIPTLATLLGILSAIIDNVPLVAATMGMYDLASYPMDAPLWQLIAYAAGTGGSILIIGSSAGVALMGMEKIDFGAYLKKASLPIFIGYLAGIGVYLLFS